MKYLTKRQVVLLHEQLINETGGIHGLRDEGLLESALAVPFQTFGAFSPYPTVQQKAARLGYGLVMNHPFIDGNKRIGAHAMLTVLAINDIEIDYSQDELAKTKESNLKEYGHEEGPLPDELYEKYGSWEMVISMLVLGGLTLIAGLFINVPSDVAVYVAEALGRW